MMKQEKLRCQYENLYNSAFSKIKNGNCKIDCEIDSLVDYRHGITLLIRPDNVVKAAIRQFINELSLIEPELYYYPDTDLHVTVLSIISCYDGFSLSTITVEEYEQIIQQSISQLKSFKLHFRGVTLSDAAVMIQGFPLDDSLNEMRSNLRKNFKKSCLEQSMDARYTISTAHCTAARFRKPLQNASRFLKYIERMKDEEFGVSEIKNVEFVFNDWYQRHEKVMLLRRYALEDSTQ